MFIEARNQILFVISILFLFQLVNANLSKQFDKKADKLLRNICQNLPSDNSDSNENQQWKRICKRWIQSINDQEDNDIQREIDDDKLNTVLVRRPRRVSSGTRSRNKNSRGSNTNGRISSLATRYRSTRTGASITRPSGWLWSRSRHAFLPISRHYFHRSHSSHHYQHTTRPTESALYYYYCTWHNKNFTREIECSTTNGEGHCCEDEKTQQGYCCGGLIDDDLVEEYSQATQVFAQIFYTLSAVALVMHIFMRRFY